MIGLFRANIKQIMILCLPLIPTEITNLRGSQCSDVSCSHQRPDRGQGSPTMAPGHEARIMPTVPDWLRLWESCIKLRDRSDHDHGQWPLLPRDHSPADLCSPLHLSSFCPVPMPPGEEVHRYPGNQWSRGDNLVTPDQYLCDGAADCSDGYDEDARLCTAARRPPVEETSSFLMSLLASHGPNYLEKLFGPKARNNMQALGGVDAVAIALSGKSQLFWRDLAW